MKHIKNNPPELCEIISDEKYKDDVIGHSHRLFICGKPAKYERLFDDPKAKPMRLCVIHARQAKRRGYTVKPI